MTSKTASYVLVSAVFVLSLLYAGLAQSRSACDPNRKSVAEGSPNIQEDCKVPSAEHTVIWKIVDGNGQEVEIATCPPAPANCTVTPSSKSPDIKLTWDASDPTRSQLTIGGLIKRETAPRQIKCEASKSGSELVSLKLVVINVFVQGRSECLAGPFEENGVYKLGGRCNFTNTYSTLDCYRCTWYEVITKPSAYSPSKIPSDQTIVQDLVTGSDGSTNYSCAFKKELPSAEGKYIIIMEAEHFRGRSDVTREFEINASMAVELLMGSVEKDLPWLSTNVTFVNKTVGILSQIMDKNVTVLSDANMGYRLLSAIDIVGREGLLSTDDQFLTVHPNLAIAAHKVDASLFAGLVLTAHAREDNHFQKNEVQIFTGTQTVPPKEISSLVLPASLLTSFSNGSRIVTAVHISGKIFEAIERARRNETWNETVSALTDDKVTKVNSYVMAVSVVGHEVMNLKDPVKINFVHIDESAVNSRCVFWNTSIEAGRGGWSTAGCWRVDQSSTDTRTLCECNHLTSFALLMDVYQRGDTVPTLHRQVQSVISYTGCGVSLLALALTILTYCVWNPTSSAKKGNVPKGQRRRTIFNKPTMILLNLCTSMALSNLVFVAGLQSYTMRHHWACKVVAMLLHLCLLSSLCWMAVEAFYMYLSLVRVFRTRVTHIILKCSAFAWGLPLLVVIITAAVDMDNYASLTSGVCWLSGIAFYAAFVAPVGLILIFNSVIFSLVLRVILTLADNRPERHRSNKAVTQLRRATGLVILLGLTWVFGFLAIEGARMVFYYLFAVFNSFQGLFIFLFYCAFNAEVRAAWKQSCVQWMDGKKQTGKANPEPKATAAERKELLNHLDVKITGSTIPSDPSSATATSSGQTGLSSLDDGTGVALTTFSISTNDRDNANQ